MRTHIRTQIRPFFVSALAGAMVLLLSACDRPPKNPVTPVPQTMQTTQITPQSSLRIMMMRPEKLRIENFADGTAGISEMILGSRVTSA